MTECNECGNDPVKAANDRATLLARLHHYRHALYLACDDDEEAVRKVMQLAEETRITQ